MDESKNKNIILGVWHVATAHQEKESPHSMLVLAHGSAGDEEIETSLKNSSVFSKQMGTLDDLTFLYEEPVNYNTPLQYRRIIKTETNYRGIGSLHVEKYSYSQNRWITQESLNALESEALMYQQTKMPIYLQSDLYAVRYRDANDRDTNPVHQTAVIAKNEDDLNTFLQGFSNWFGEGGRALREINSDIQLVNGIMVMPQIAYNLKGLEK